MLEILTDLTDIKNRLQQIVADLEKISESLHKAAAVGNDDYDPEAASIPSGNSDTCEADVDVCYDKPANVQDDEATNSPKPEIKDDEPDSDDRSDASGSTTPNSTSTYQYAEMGHEPYASFQYKVISLLTEIGGDDVKLMDRMCGGGFNRIVLVDISESEQELALRHRAIVRIPTIPQLD